jgi:hypothetical protein
MAFLKINRGWFMVILLVLFGLACGLTAEEPTPTIQPPPVVTVLTPEPTDVPGSVDENATPTLAGGESVPEPTVTLGGSAVPTVDIDTEATYRIIHVDQNDILNVRSGAGAGNPIVTTLAPGTTGVRIVGFGQTVDGSLWVPINVNQSSGWINSNFLTEDIPSDEFCNDPQTADLLDELKTAVQNRDSEALAAISKPERGLRFRRYWWSEGVRFENQQINSLFDLAQSYYWGVQGGSGEDINGSFSEVMLPLLDRDLLSATQTGCNEILNGGTAGIIQLPIRYEGANYYAAYRPAPAGQELDWGTWVVGIERWQDEYFISFLVHYQWEI